MTPPGAWANRTAARVGKRENHTPERREKPARKIAGSRPQRSLRVDLEGGRTVVAAVTATVGVKSGGFGGCCSKRQRGRVQPSRAIRAQILHAMESNWLGRKDLTARIGRAHRPDVCPSSKGRETRRSDAMIARGLASVASGVERATHASLTHRLRSAASADTRQHPRRRHSQPGP